MSTKTATKPARKELTVQEQKDLHAIIDRVDNHIRAQHNGIIHRPTWESGLTDAACAGTFDIAKAIAIHIELNEQLIAACDTALRAAEVNRQKTNPI